MTGGSWRKKDWGYPLVAQYLHARCVVTVWGKRPGERYQRKLFYAVR